uniref:Uncharacterized protein n=1 Tax=Magallana gigas TaxID=29159 RepID=A0A8W8HRM1_MAGGI
MLARTIDSFDKRVALRLMNLPGQIQTIYKITVVGVTSPVTDVPESDQVKVVNCIVAGKEGENIPGHLNELYKEATTDLTEEHKTKGVREDEDWGKDLGELKFDEVEVGRTFRKRTTPRLSGIKRKAVEEPVLSEGKGKEPQEETEVCETTYQEEPLKKRVIAFVVRLLGEKK